MFSFVFEKMQSADSSNIEYMLFSKYHLQQTAGENEVLHKNNSYKQRQW